MIKGIVLAAFLFANILAPVYIATDTGSSVKFKIKNLGVTISGSFKGLKGNIQFDPSNLPTSTIEATINASTINTGIDLRDDHLKKEEYFDVKNHPQIRFVSTKITPSNKSGTLFVFGKLTIKNITKDISFPFTATPQNNGFLFNGEFKINRRDYTVGGSSFTLGDNLTVQLSIFATKG